VKEVHFSAKSRINNFVAQRHKTEDLNPVFNSCLKITLYEDQTEEVSLYLMEAINPLFET
jgi:hypothetical protein